MDQDANYAVVGIFVVILTSVLVLGIIWLSSGLSFHANKTYEVIMAEPVSGLSVDAVVEYNGVNVGHVKSIEIDRKQPKLVRLLLDVRYDTPVTVATRASLNTRGLTGVSLIALKDNGENITPLVTLPHQKYPIIAASPTSSLQWESILNRLSENFSKVSQAIQKLLSDENLRYVNQTLKHVDQVSAALAASSHNMSAIINRSANVMQSIQQQTLPATNKLMNDLGQTATNLSIISNEMRDNPSILIRGRAPQPAGPGE